MLSAFHQAKFTTSIIVIYSALMSCTSGTTSSSGPPQKGASDCQTSKNQSESSGGSESSPAYGLAADEDVWTDVKKVLLENCTSCHDDFAKHEVASGKIDAFIKFTDLNEGEEGFMPKDSAKLSLVDRTRLIEWRVAGMPQDGGAEADGTDIAIGDDESGEEESGQDDTSRIDSDGSDWGDEPPPPPKSSTVGC